MAWLKGGLGWVACVLAATVGLGGSPARAADTCPAPFTQVDAAPDPIEDFDADRLFVHRSDGRCQSSTAAHTR